MKTRIGLLFVLVSVSTLGCGTVTTADDVDGAGSARGDAGARDVFAAADVGAELGAPADAGVEWPPPGCAARASVSYRCDPDKFLGGIECLRCYADPNDVSTDLALAGDCMLYTAAAPAGVTGVCVANCNDCAP